MIDAYEGRNNNVATDRQFESKLQKAVEPEEDSIFVMSSSQEPVRVQCQATDESKLGFEDDDLSVIKQPSRVSFDEDTPQAQT